MYEPLMEFIGESEPSTDFFCFQEVFNGDNELGLDLGRNLLDFKLDILSKLMRALQNFDLFYAPTSTVKMGDGEVTVGLAIFSKKGIKIDSKGDVTICRCDKSDDLFGSSRNMQYVRLINNGAKITLCNFHGTVFPGDKLDTGERLSQSRRIVEFLNKEDGERVLGGDFNLMPQTKSIEIIESSGMSNLIKDFNISSTRSDISYEMYKHMNNQQHFADYVFVSSDVNAKSFEVPRLGISDHLPLILQLD